MHTTIYMQAHNNLPINWMPTLALLEFAIALIPFAFIICILVLFIGGNSFIMQKLKNAFDCSQTSIWRSKNVFLAIA